MKNYQKQKCLIATLLLLTMIPLFMIPSSANSAQTEWKGRDESEVIVTDGDCPIVVEHETLTFDIQELPQYSYYDEHPSSPAGTVSAEYTFYNPSDMTVTTKLAFPVGDSYQAWPGNYTDYQITLNGEVVESQTHHTIYYYYANDFDLSVDLPKLCFDYKDDDFYKMDLPVTQYTITLPYYALTGSNYTRYGIDINPDNYPNTEFYFPDKPHWHVLEDGTYRLYDFARPGREITFYAIGEKLENAPVIRVYEDYKCNDDQLMTNDLAVVRRSGECTLGDLIFEKYDESRGISKIDWYNANIDLLRAGRDKNLPRVNVSDFTDFGEAMLRTWYCYEITLAPGERVTNKITAPIYPDISEEYRPSIFKYTYLLSPASTWTDFGTLDIVINTPFYMVKNNIDGFEKTENGYSLTLNGLPKDESGEYIDLNFILSESENPEWIYGSFLSNNKSKPGFFKAIGNFFVSIFNAIVNFFKRIFSF